MGGESDLSVNRDCFKRFRATLVFVLPQLIVAVKPSFIIHVKGFSCNFLHLRFHGFTCDILVCIVFRGVVPGHIHQSSVTYSCCFYHVYLYILTLLRGCTPCTRTDVFRPVAVFSL